MVREGKDQHMAMFFINWGKSLEEKTTSKNYEFYELGKCT